MMKRLLKYLPAVILALASCSREPLPQVERSSPDDHCIVLTFANVHPSLTTKTGSIRGDNRYNENLVQRVDCFFYPNGATSSNAVFTAIGRGADVVEVEPDSLEYKVKIFFTDDDAMALFGSTTSGTCQAYVVCNAPLSYGSNTSVNALKERVLEHDFSAQVVMGSFVMHADAPFSVTLSTTGDVTSAGGRVNVSRSAAKIQLFMEVPEKIWDDENNKYWYPLLDTPGAQVRMRYLVKRGKVDGTYSPGSGDLVTTPYRAFTELASSDLVPGRSDYIYSHSPFYSYPTTWHDLSEDAPFFVFRIPWQMDGSPSYEYRVYQLSPNLAGKIFEPNHYYRSYVSIHSLGGADEDHSVVISDCSYIIIPWLEDDTNAGQGLVPAEFMDYKFLVIGVPDVTLNNEQTASFDYVSSGDITSVNITKIIYYNNSQASPKQTLTSGTAFNNAKNTITINTDTPGVITVTHPLNGIYSQWEIFATVTNEDGITADIHITQNPPIRLLRDSDKYGDVFVNGYFARVKNSPFGTSWTFNNNTYYRDPKSSNGNNAVTMPSPSSNYGTTIYKGNVTSGNLSTFYTTEVNISSFNSSNNTYSYVYGGTTYTRNYRIGDPRKTSEDVYDSSWSLYPYLYYNNTTQGATKDWESPLKILMTSQNESEQDIVAPRFLVSSSLNAMLTSGLPTFDQAVSRAATYQEAGYPAGRWRIPTEAEMAFIVARQQDQTIPDLYVSGSDYWSGSGRLMSIASSGTTITMKDGGTAKESVRFVYDLWYWGDEASTTNVYHPDGHIYDYDASGNKTARTL